MKIGKDQPSILIVIGEKMNTNERIKLQDEIRAVFESGDILSVPDDKMQLYISSLCLEPVNNEGMRHAKIIQALTINHIQIKRHIDRLNRQNTILQIIIIVLTGIVLVTATVQTYTTIKYSKESLQQPTKQESLLKSVANPNIHNEATKGGSSTSSHSPYEKKK